MAKNDTVYAYPARIHLLTDEQTAALNLPDDIENPFAFETISSNNSLDFYYTHMLESSLRNFAADGAAGVQLLESHNNRNLGYGRTFNGRFNEDASQKPDFVLPNPDVELAIATPNTLQQAILNTYTVPGIRFGGANLTYASTDDFILALRAGLIVDISIGFYGGRWICDICGGNYRSYSECPHFAGVEYPLGEQGDRIVLSTVSVDNAHIAEHSVVYDGATPGAEIVRKAEGLARSNDIEPDIYNQLERRYKLELPRKVQHFNSSAAKKSAANSVNGRQANNQRERGGTMDFEQQVNEILERLKGVGEQGATAVQRVAALVQENSTLRPLADDGRTYRGDLIDEAIKQGVRAMGTDFGEEAYRATLENNSIEVIKRFSSDWQRMADANLAGGRLTTEENDDGKPKTKTQRRRPIGAHKV